VSPSEKTKREQSISKEKTKKKEREKAAKKKGGGNALILGPLAYLCGTRALLQRLTAMAIRRNKRRTSALRSARERERGAKKRQRGGTRRRRWRAPSCVHMEWAKPTLWPSPVVFKWTWPRTLPCG